MPVRCAKSCFNAFTEASANSSFSKTAIDSPATAETTSTGGGAFGGDGGGGGGAFGGGGGGACSGGGGGGGGPFGGGAGGTLRGGSGRGAAIKKNITSKSSKPVRHIETKWLPENLASSKH